MTNNFQKFQEKPPRKRFPLCEESVFLRGLSTPCRSSVPCYTFAMKEILFKNATSVPKKRKAISISETSEDKECKTFVRKSFIYLVTPQMRIEQTIPQPDITIRKFYCTKTKEEKFSFRVKGYFYIAKEYCFLKVSFCHSLKINILWKAKVFSPKSATLT